jgi:prophage maintenance system killer protein
MAEIETLQATIALGVGDKVGVRDRAALEAALAEPYRKVGDISLFETAPRRAAALAAALLTNRCFASCNRRTTVDAVRVWIEREDYTWHGDLEDIVEAVDELAEGRMSRQEFMLWVARNTNRNSEDPGGDPGIKRIGSRASYGPPPKAYPAKWLLNPKVFIEKNWGKGF